MSSANVIRIARGLIRKIGRGIEECWYAQRRLETLRTSPDMYSDRPNDAPDSFAEFMFRTSGPLLHEPSARQRRRGALTPR